MPDHCALTVDIRSTPALHAAGGAEAFLRNWMERNFPEPVAVSVLGANCPPLDVDPHHSLVRRLAKAGNGLTGAPWFCDAVHLAEAGLPAVAAGPGSIAQAHTDDEFLAIEDLENGVAFYREFLESDL